MRFDVFSASLAGKRSAEKLGPEGLRRKAQERVAKRWNRPGARGLAKRKATPNQAVEALTVWFAVSEGIPGLQYWRSQWDEFVRWYRRVNPPPPAE